MILKQKYFLFLTIGILSCNTSNDLPNFDESSWQKDHNGCQEIRLDMLDDLEQVKDDLKGLNTDKVVQILGKPDKNELYERNQKFFIYEIRNAPACPDHQEDRSHMYLSIRFNATGLAKEIMVYKD